MTFRERLFPTFCLLFVFFVAAAASVNGFYQRWHLGEAYPETNVAASAASLDGLLTGTGPRPFVYRQLLPTVANFIDSETPERVKEKLYSLSTPGGHPFRERWFATPLARTRAFFLRYWIVYLLTYFCAFAATCAMYLLVTHLAFEPLYAAISAVILILLIPLFMSMGGFFYDYAELLFFTLAADFALRGKWGWLILIAVLATFNKESFLLFVPCLYPLLREGRSRSVAIWTTAGIGLASCAVVLMLRWRYAQNPGVTTEFHLMDQLSYLVHPWNTLRPQDITYGLVCLPALNPITLLLIAYTAWRGWSLLPAVIRHYSIWAISINLPLYFLFCHPGEVRNLSFLYISLLFLISVHIVDMSSKTRAILRKEPTDSRAF